MLCHHEALPTTLYKRLIYVVYVETACGLKHAGMTRMAQGVEHQLLEAPWLHVHSFCQEPGGFSNLHNKSTSCRVTSCHIMLHHVTCYVMLDHRYICTTLTPSVSLNTASFSHRFVIMPDKHR